MKALPVAFLAAATSAAVCAAAILVADPGRSPASSPTGGGADVETSLRDLRRSVAALDATLADLRSEMRSGAPPSIRTPAGGIDEAVDAWMREHLDEWLARVAVPAEAVAPKGPEPADLQSFLAELADPDLSRGGWEEIWKRIREAGLTDEAVAHFERLAELDPSNPEAQVALGGAYLQKIFEVGNSPEAGTWATKADRAFDRALELDSGHWEARFAKAVSLSFWPPVFGKQREAIEHFEILSRQQDGMSPAPAHAETYLYLGNLYEQLGQLDKAKEAWKKGASMFPTNAELASKAKIGGF